MTVRRTTWLIGALATAAILVVVVFQLRYRSWPLQAPHQLAWCGMGWERDTRATDPPATLYPVGRKPPLIGPRFYSPYPPARRAELSAAEMGEPCGGQLLAREGGRLVTYVADPATPH
jgi:hypothetical protein